MRITNILKLTKHQRKQIKEQMSYKNWKFRNIYYQNGI